MSKTFTPADVATHNTPDKGLYIIVDSAVYDVTKFVDEHPGGAKILKRVAGKDATKQFWKVCILNCPSSLGVTFLVSLLRWPIVESRGSHFSFLCDEASDANPFLPAQYHNDSVLKKYAPKLKVGDVKEGAKL
jgi:predicted heme/steroid binding protein